LPLKNDPIREPTDPTPEPDVELDDSYRVDPLPLPWLLRGRMAPPVIACTLCTIRSIVAPVTRIGHRNIRSIAASVMLAPLDRVGGAVITCLRHEGHWPPPSHVAMHVPPFPSIATRCLVCSWPVYTPSNCCKLGTDARRGSTVDLLQLEHFLAVVDERTFTRAAERVGRTQPAISQSIKKLEEEVGTPLFARDVHEVSLTEAGRVLVEYARKMVRARDDAMRDVGALKALKTGTLNIAAHESAAVYLLPEPLRCYLARFPDVKIGIFRSRLTDIPRQVLDREVDIGFVKDEPGFHDLKWVDVHADEMILIASPNHLLARRAKVRIRDLGSEQFVVHHLCSTTEQKILRLFEEHATRCHIVAELWSFENIKSFVQAEVGL